MAVYGRCMQCFVEIVCPSADFGRLTLHAMATVVQRQCRTRRLFDKHFQAVAVAVPGSRAQGVVQVPGAMINQHLQTVAVPCTGGNG